MAAHCEKVSQESLTEFSGDVGEKFEGLCLKCLQGNFRQVKAPPLVIYGDIDCKDYDKWLYRYNCPKYDAASGYGKVPSQGLSDAMVEAFKDRLKEK